MSNPSYTIQHCVISPAVQFGQTEFYWHPQFNGGQQKVDAFILDPKKTSQTDGFVLFC